MTDSATGDPEAAGTGGAPLEPVQAVTAAAGFAVSTWWRATRWGADAAWRAGSRVARAAVSGESPTHLASEAGAQVRDQARRVLGIAQIEDVMRAIAGQAARNGAAPNGSASSRDAADRLDTGTVSASAAVVTSNGNGRSPQEWARLRELGAELMRRSADVTYDEDVHPAYARILGELAADEARILRLLWIEGPEPAVDVRASQLLGVSSQLVAPGLSMIGLRAGCRHPERVPAYLNNLHRLGLVWFSREPVADTQRYQVLEVQPDVEEAKRVAGRARTLRRSIHLTAFGRDFCDGVLPSPVAETR